MSVIHVSEEEAARDLPGLLAKARAGDEVLINTESDSFTIVRSGTAHPASWTTADALRSAEARNSAVLLDDAFGDDMEEIMRFNRLERPDPWESS